MSTRRQDCLKAYCTFSSLHAAGILAQDATDLYCANIFTQTGCKHAGPCQRQMGAPQRNPIRISDTRCEGCVMRGPEGVLGRTHITS